MMRVVRVRPWHWPLQLKDRELESVLHMGSVPYYRYPVEPRKPNWNVLQRLLRSISNDTV